MTSFFPCAFGPVGRAGPCRDRRGHLGDVVLRHLHVGIVRLAGPDRWRRSQKRSRSNESRHAFPPLACWQATSSSAGCPALSDGQQAADTLCDRLAHHEMSSSRPACASAAPTARGAARKPASAMETTSVTPLNSGSTKNAPPSCWMPEMPTARISTPTDRAPDIDPAGLDRGRAEEGADQRRQQEIEADVGLADPELRGEHAAGEAGDQRPRRRRRR